MKNKCIQCGCDEQILLYLCDECKEVFCHSCINYTRDGLFCDNCQNAIDEYYEEEYTLDMDDWIRRNEEADK